MGAAFETHAKEAGQALLLPTAVVAGIVFGPVISGLDLVSASVQVVVWLMVKLLDTLWLLVLGCTINCIFTSDNWRHSSIFVHW